MPYQVKTSKEFDRFLENHRDLAPKVLSSFRQITQNPYENTLDIAKLEEQILIYTYKASSRGDVYK